MNLPSGSADSSRRGARLFIDTAPGGGACPSLGGEWPYPGL